MTPDERNEQLDALLAEGTTKFSPIMQLFADWPPGPDLEAALERAAPLGRGWWPSSAVGDFGTNHPAWRLASWMHLDRPELPDLRSLPTIRTLRLHRHLELPNLHEVAEKAPQLRTLQVASNPTFASLRGLSQLEELTELRISGCGPLHDIVELPTRLTQLHLSTSGKLSSTAPLEGLVALEDLSLRSHRGIHDISTLASCNRMKTLNLERVGMQDLDALASCQALETLSVSGCKQLRSIEGLRALPNLRVVALDSCKSLEDVSVLESLPQLEGVSIVGVNASGAERLDAMPTLTRIQRTPSMLPWPFP